MSVLETVAQKLFDLVIQNAAVSVGTGIQNKIACAFPTGNDPATFGPWKDQVLSQVSFEADFVTGAAIEIDFRITYKTSAAGQYIDEVFADSLVKVPIPYSLDAKIQFRDSSLDTITDGLEMAKIPFLIVVTRSHPLFGIRSGRAIGELRGDGQGTLNAFETIEF